MGKPGLKKNNLSLLKITTLDNYSLKTLVFRTRLRNFVIRKGRSKICHLLLMKNNTSRAFLQFNSNVNIDGKKTNIIGWIHPDLTLIYLITMADSWAHEVDSLLKLSKFMWTPNLKKYNQSSVEFATLNGYRSKFQVYCTGTKEFM